MIKFLLSTLFAFSLLFSAEFANAAELCSSLGKRLGETESIQTDSQKQPLIWMEKILAQRKIQDFVARAMEKFEAQPGSDAMARLLFKSVKNLVSDATSKRVENKLTASNEAVIAEMESLGQSLKSVGKVVEYRDKIPAGRKNVTVTGYTKPIYFKVSQLAKAGFEVTDALMSNPNKKVKMKVRTRYYGTVDARMKTFKISDVEPSDYTKDRVFVEFKFGDSSTEENAGFKPQMYMNREHAKLLESPEFILKFKEIKEDVLSHLKISKKKTLDRESVEAMLDFLYEAHRARLDMQIKAISIYARIARALQLEFFPEFDPMLASRAKQLPREFELQMTFDEMVSLFLPGENPLLGEGKYYYSYKIGDVVVEFKTPIYLSHHINRARIAAEQRGLKGLYFTTKHAAELDSVAPGLREYLTALSFLIVKSDESKGLDQGKRKTALTTVGYELEKTISEVVNAEIEP